MRLHVSEVWCGCVVASILMLGVNANGCVTAQPSKEEVRKTSNNFEFRPGVIIDPDRSVVYLMNPQHGIDAVDLASGKLPWRVERAAKPLLYSEELLVAQTEPQVGQQLVRIALLNTREINADPRFIDIPLPADVQATIDDRMESSFSVAARTHEGAIVLSWSYTYRRITGPPPSSDDQALDRKVTGSVRIDIHTGQVNPIDEMMDLSKPELPSAVIGLKNAQEPPGAFGA